MERHGVGLTVSINFNIQSLGQSVDNRSTNTVQATGGCIGSAAKFSTSVQFGENNLDTRKSSFWLNINRHSAAVIFYGHAAVFIEFYSDVLAVTG